MRRSSASTWSGVTTTSCPRASGSAMTLKSRRLSSGTAFQGSLSLKDLLDYVDEPGLTRMIARWKQLNNHTRRNGEYGRRFRMKRSTSARQAGPRGGGAPIELLVYYVG